MEVSFARGLNIWPKLEVTFSIQLFMENKISINRFMNLLSQILSYYIFF